MEDKKQEEIDILYLLNSFKKGVLNLLSFLVNIISFSFKKLVPLSVFVLIFTSISLGVFYLQKPYYTSTITVSHSRLENDYCSAMVNNLNSFVNEYDANAQLARILSMNPDQAKEIKSLKYIALYQKIPALKSETEIDSSAIILPFTIEAEVYNNSVLDSLQVKLLTYLENNEYATRRKEIDKINLDKLEARVIKEISEIDSLKTVVKQGILPRSSGNGIILGEPIQPITLYYRTMELYEKQLNIEKKKTLNNSFELVVGFAKNYIRSGVKRSVFILVGLLLGYLIGMIYLGKKVNFSFENQNK